jgi:Rod binding domain-containing protein
MSIFPATDLVTDVAHAADPRKLSAAMKRLTDVSDGRATTGVQFASALQSAAAAPAPGHAASAPAGTDSPASAAARKFEAYIIQSFLEIVLPKDDQGAYGHGAAGGVWRSMMAEQLGTQIAKAGGVGLQKMLDRQLTHRGGDARASAAVS